MLLKVGMVTLQSLTLKGGSGRSEAGHHLEPHSKFQSSLQVPALNSRYDFHG